MNSSYTSSSKPTFVEFSEFKNVLAWNRTWFHSEKLKEPRNHTDIGYMWLTWWLPKTYLWPFYFFDSLICFNLHGITVIIILVSGHRSWLGLRDAILIWESQPLNLRVRSAVPGMPTVFWVWFLFSFSTVFLSLMTVKSLSGLRILCPLLGGPSEGISFISASDRHFLFCFQILLNLKKFLNLEKCISWSTFSTNASE